ncbi:MAG: cupin domain-containing protein, partial [Clostridiales bacterium]|nr:cupin domain-containing protein [Clostridiales bacterium]
MVNEISLEHFNKSPDQKYHLYRISGSAVSKKPHTHSYYQICYVERGEIQHWSGNSFVSSHFGDAFIVPPGFVHSIVFPNDDSQMYSLSFEENMFHPGFPHSGAYRFMTALKLDASKQSKIDIRMKVTLNKDQRFIMQALLESLLRESSSNYPAELSSAASLIAAILYILAQAYFMDEQHEGKYDMISQYDQSLKEC